MNTTSFDWIHSNGSFSKKMNYSISIAQSTQIVWNGKVDQIMALYKSDYFRCVSPIYEIWLDLI